MTLDFRPGAPVEVALDPIKKSRFVGRLVPVTTRDQATEAVAELRAAWPDARHHAWAWRLGAGGRDVRSSDDGEPSGTAGRPCLQALERAGLIDCIVVVTRFSGGIKLGTGGLVRAYGAAARAAVDAVEPVEVIEMSHFRVTSGYEDAQAIQRRLDATDAVVATAWEADVHFEVTVAAVKAESLINVLIDLTAGRARVDVQS